MRRLTFVILAATLSCDGGPTAPTRAIDVDMCEGFDWVAIQNEGRPWRRLSTGAQSIQVTERVALAWVRFSNVHPSLDVAYVTASQVEELLECPPPTSFRQLNGTLQGVPEGGLVWMSYGAFEEFLLSVPRFRLFAAAYGTRDLVAVRWPPYTPNGRVERLLVRRAQDYSNDTIPPMDFESAEAFAPTSHVASWTGPGGSVVVSFLTLTGNLSTISAQATLPTSTADVARTLPIDMVPAGRLAGGDLHSVRLNSGNRYAWHYMHAPGDVTLSLGPEASAPSFTRLATTPRVRYRVDVASQPQYAERVVVYMTQEPATDGDLDVSVNLQATREFFATAPANWSLEMPDFGNIGGIGTQIGFDTRAIAWYLTASSRPLGFKENTAAPGTVHREALRAGDHAPPE
jgi:hypothetical protein